jgi:hypothetical protein
VTDPADEADAVVVVDVPEARRYEVRVGGTVAGFTAYRPVQGRIIFTHTEISPDYEGRGLGSRLAAGALDDVRSRGLLVTPLCPFIAAYIGRHPEYADLVALRPGPPS